MTAIQRHGVRVAAALLAGATALLSLSVRAAEPVVPAPEPTLRLLSQSQYANTIANIFGPDVGVKIRFAPVNRVDGLLAVGRSTAVLTSGALDPLDAAARSIAAQVIDAAHRSLLVPCKPVAADVRDDQCARRFFSQVGRLISRRALTPQELEQAVELAGRGVGTVKSTDGFYSGLAFALAGMLVSPQFLYVWEQAEPDPAHADRWRLDG
jgi:hypothetical protein